MRDVSTPLDMTKGLFSTLDIYHDDAPQSAAMNMAIDEALLETAEIPTIRFYRWDHDAVSFGYFGKFADVASYASERELVRRWTGGGIVFHGNDLTYSIVIPESDPIFSEASMSIYERIHHALCGVLREAGHRATVAGVGDPGSSKPATTAAVSARGYNCFANPVRADVMLNGQKIAGAAQRRTKRGLLQQGSIQFVGVGNGLAECFAKALASDCHEGNLDAAILDRARELALQKYGAEAWSQRR